MVDFYIPVRSELSQGDIIDGLPYGLIPDPLTICRPKTATSAQGPGYYAPAAEFKSSSPGGAAFTKDRTERVHANGKLGLLMVVWEDCEIDRFGEQGKPENKWYAGVAPILQEASLTEGDRAAVAEGRRRRFFPLPADTGAGIERANEASPQTYESCAEGSGRAVRLGFRPFGPLSGLLAAEGAVDDRSPQ